MCYPPEMRGPMTPKSVARVTRGRVQIPAQHMAPFLIGGQAKAFRFRLLARVGFPLQKGEQPALTRYTGP